MKKMIKRGAPIFLMLFLTVGLLSTMKVLANKLTTDGPGIPRDSKLYKEGASPAEAASTDDQVADMGRWVMTPDSALETFQREVTYDPNGGAIYYHDKKAKKKVFCNGPLRDYYDRRTVKDAPYRLIVGGSFTKYQFAVQKGNQDPAQGRVKRFVGWYTDKDYKNPFKGDYITSTAKTNLNLYARYMYDSDLTVPTTEYNKKHNSESFNLKAVCTSKITYKSDNTKIATVDKKGNVKIKGLVGTCKIEVATEGNQDFAAKQIDVTINVKTAGPAKISKIHNNSNNEITVAWNKTKNVDGYKLWVSTNIKFPEAETNDYRIEGGDKTSIRLSKFAPKKKFVVGKKYFFRLSAYKTVKEKGSGTVINAVYSNPTPIVTYAIKK